MSTLIKPQPQPPAPRPPPTRRQPGVDGAQVHRRRHDPQVVRQALGHRVHLHAVGGGAGRGGAGRGKEAQQAWAGGGRENAGRSSGKEGRERSAPTNAAAAAPVPAPPLLPTNTHCCSPAGQRARPRAWPAGAPVCGGSGAGGGLACTALGWVDGWVTGGQGGAGDEGGRGEVAHDSTG